MIYKDIKQETRKDEKDIVILILNKKESVIIFRITQEINFHKKIGEKVKYMYRNNIKDTNGVILLCKPELNKFYYLSNEFIVNEKELLEKISYEGICSNLYVSLNYYI